MDLRRITRKTARDPIVRPGVVLCVLWLILWHTPVSAGTLKIETRLRVTVSSAHQIQIEVTAHNRGPEAAHAVRVFLTLWDQKDESAPYIRVEPGASATATFERNGAKIPPGCYPLTALVVFHDANQYPFSALTGTTVCLGQPPEPDLIVEAGDISLAQKARLTFNLKNLAAGSREVRGRLFLPRELSADPEGVRFSVKGRSHKRITWSVHNFSALNGASYPVAAFFEYDAGGMHQTALARPMIRIIPEENLFLRTRWLWIGVAVILGALLGALILKGRKDRSRFSP